MVGDASVQYRTISGHPRLGRYDTDQRCRFVQKSKHQSQKKRRTNVFDQPRVELPPNTAFQSDPRRPALYKIVGILAVGSDLSMPIAARAAERQADPRNDRAHALLEHSDPQTSIMGGRDRGIEWRDSGYLIEPYRGDTRNVITATYKILSGLYRPSVK